MIILLIHLLRLLPFLCGGHRQLALENLALRQQLAVYKRTVNRPKLQQSDRLLWVWLSRVWPAWRQALVIVSPAPRQATRRRRRDQSPGQKNGRGQSAVGCSQNPWRTAQARHRRRWAHRLPSA